MVQYIIHELYKVYYDALPGLNDENVESVRAKLRKIGVLQGNLAGPTGTPGSSVVAVAPQGSTMDTDTRTLDGDKCEGDPDWAQSGGK